MVLWARPNTFSNYMDMVLGIADSDRIAAASSVACSCKLLMV